MTEEKTGGAIRQAKRSLLHKLLAENDRFDGALAAELAVRFIISLLLALPRLLGGYYPLGLGMVASVGAGLRGTVTLAGAVIGYLFTGSYAATLKYVCACFLTYAATYICRSSRFSRRGWFAPLIGAAFLLCMQIAFDFGALGRGGNAALCALELGVVSLTAVCYRTALMPYRAADGKPEYRHGICLAALTASVLCAAVPLRLFGVVSVGRVLLALLVMILGFKGGCSIGCSGGLAVGLLADIISGTLPYFSLAYALAGLGAGLLARFGRLHYIVSFVLVNAVCCLLMWSSAAGTSGLYEAFMASVIFMLIPNHYMARLGIWFPANSLSYGALQARMYTSHKVSRAAEAFSHLYSTVKTVSGGENNDGNMAAIFDRAAEICCRECENAGKCWQKNYSFTLDALNDLMPVMRDRGFVSCDDLPNHFTEQCIKPDSLIAAINEELRSLLYRRQYRARLQEKLGAAYDQYRDISVVLEDIAGELCRDSVFDPAMEKRLQKFLKSMDVDASTAVFRDYNNRLHMEITGSSLALLTRDEQYLNKISQAVGMRLCSSGYKHGSGKLVLLEAEPYSVTVGIAAIRKNGQTVSGDKGTYFKTDEGVLYILLSDGMGTGEFAARCSSDTVRILEQFLRAGVQPEISLRILNNLMLLKNENDLYSATVDLMAINLFTGEAVVYKYGAAPSYLCRGGSVRRIRGRTFSVGMVDGDGSPDRTDLSLNPGDRVVMLSDGAVSGGDDKWIGPTLEKCSGLGARDCARALMENAISLFGADDDMTILTICYDSRK